MYHQHSCVVRASFRSMINASKPKTIQPCWQGAVTWGTYIYYNQRFRPIISPVIRASYFGRNEISYFQKLHTDICQAACLIWNTFFQSVLIQSLLSFLWFVLTHASSYQALHVFPSFFNIPVPMPIICEVISLRIGRSNNDLSRVYAEGMFNLNIRFFLNSSINQTYFWKLIFYINPHVFFGSPLQPTINNNIVHNDWK